MRGCRVGSPKQKKPIVRRPSVEPGYLNDVTKFSTLNSAVPLEGLEGLWVC